MKESSVSFAYQSAKSLLYNIPDRVGVIYRPIYEKNALTPERLPLNSEEEIFSSFMTTIRERNIQPPLVSRPYWDTKIHYDPLEVFGATIQSVDLHDAPLPTTVLPPEKDVADFITGIKSSSDKVKLNQQFNLALNITENNLLGAANLCWIATRFMGRGADQRAYPNILMNAQEVRDWNNALAQFETYNNSGKNDSPGDTYYFWTHVFAAMVFSDQGLENMLAQLAFSHGTKIMEMIRKHIAKKQPNITAHEPASELGRTIGLALTSLDKTMLS
jgi:hypothetical protein